MEKNVYQGFSDKFFIFQYITVFSVGSAIIGRCFNCLTYSRYHTRKRLILNQLVLNSVLAYILDTLLFVFIVIGNLFYSEKIQLAEIYILLGKYFRVFVGSYMFVCVTMILEYSGKAALKAYAQCVTVLIMASEVLFVIPKLRHSRIRNVNILFSWIFYTSVESYYAMVIISIGLTAILFWECKRRDWL